MASPRCVPGAALPWQLLPAAGAAPAFPLLLALGCESCSPSGVTVPRALPPPALRGPFLAGSSCSWLGWWEQLLPAVPAGCG